jgi:hypothetical protein
MTGMPHYINSPRKIALLLLITTAVLGLFLLANAAWIYFGMLVSAGAGGVTVGHTLFSIMFPPASLTAIIILSLYSLLNNSNICLYASITLSILVALSLAFDPVTALPFEAAAQGLRIWPNRYEQVNFPLNVRRERKISASNEPIAIAWSPDGSKIAAVFSPDSLFLHQRIVETIVPML